MTMTREDLIAAVTATAECMGYTLSPAAGEMMAGELAAYPAHQVASALRDCMHQLHGRLTLAAIIERLHAHDGHPSANEAWAIALESTDEYQSVSLTPQIQQALGAAQPVLSTGDKVGARMAFLAAYERLVTQARQHRQPATWTLSIGFDVAGRQRALEAAQSAGRLTYQPDPMLALPPPPSDDPPHHPGRAAVLELLAEWEREKQQQHEEKLRQRQRDLEQLEQRRAQIKEQWEQKMEERGHVSTGFKPNRSKYKKMKKKRVYG